MLNFIIEYKDNILSVLQWQDGCTNSVLFSELVVSRQDAEQSLLKFKSILNQLPIGYQVAIDEESAERLTNLGISFKSKSIYKQIEL